VRALIDEAVRCKVEGKRDPLLVNLCGHGPFDMQAYIDYFSDKLLDPDAAKRKANIEYVTERRALADAVGSRCCVDLAGSFHPTIGYGPHPKNLGKESSTPPSKTAAKSLMPSSRRKPFSPSR
jgi:hypothetical protein